MPIPRDRSVNANYEIYTYAYSRWSFSLLNLGNLSTRTALYLTAKEFPHEESDTQAVLQVKETTGLLAINKAPVSVADRAKGTLTVNNATRGDITVTVEEDMTGMEQVVGYLSVRMITTTGPQEMMFGSLTVLASPTRTIA